MRQVVNYFTILSIALHIFQASDGIHSENGMKCYIFWDIPPLHKMKNTLSFTEYHHLFDWNQKYTGHLCPFFVPDLPYPLTSTISVCGSVKYSAPFSVINTSSSKPR